MVCCNPEQSMTKVVNLFEKIQEQMTETMGISVYVV